MRRGLACVAGFLLCAAALSAAPCTPSPTALCLNDSRFEVEVSWRDSRARTGVGQAKSITADTGYFWFFSESNIELVIKVLDARSINQKFWVFFGALTSVEFDLNVTDTVTGAVKTYHNALGTFASVGDTGAFDPASPSPPHETTTVAGTATPASSLEALQAFVDSASSAATRAFAPCPHVGAALRLNGCRFSLEVEWRDSRGREGRGTPVQLTNDTGYFWFFSPENVELVIKVLDARSINGNHWVFYGALSSVQYTLTVTDSWTGAVRTYSNPSGSFASVGDTGGFHAGRSVGAVPDSTREAFATFDSAGGSLSATGADGTQYELELPPDALGMEMSVRMTPLARVDSLPLSRGLVGAVQLEPEGLRLFLPATLHIRPPHPLRRGIVGFSFHGPGEDFALDFGETDAGEVRVPVLHFSGAGAGAAGPGDAGSAAAPLDTMAYIRQLALQIMDRAQDHEDEDGNIIPAEISLEERHDLLVALFIDVAYNVIIPRLQATLPDCNKPTVVEAIMLALSCTKTIEFFTDADQIPELKEAIDAITAKILDVLTHCLEKFFNDCKDRKDPFIAWDMVLILKYLDLFGVEVPGILDQGTFLERCLRFKIVFDSSFDVNLPPTTQHRRARAEAKLRIDPDSSIKDVAWSGTGPIKLEELSIAYDGCNTTITGKTESTFEAGKKIPALVMPVAFAGAVSSDPELYTSIKLRVGHDPGNPMEAHRFVCDGLPGDVPMDGVWRGVFDAFHPDEAKGTIGFLAETWDVFNLNGLWARANYQRTKGPITEDTEIVIEHTPDAPD